MTGVNKLSSCVAAMLICSNTIATAAAPATDGFDQWTLTDGTITTTDSSTCPEGFTCATAVTGEGFYQRQITDGSGNDYFQTIITDKSTSEPTPGSLAFSDESYVQTGTITDLPDRTVMLEAVSDITIPPRTTLFGYGTFAYHRPFAFLDDVSITDATYASPDLSLYSDATIGPLLPGENLINWYVNRPDGLGTITSEIIYNTPEVNFGPDQIAVEGSSVTITAHLNGTPNTYPITIPFSLSGTTALTDDHNGVDGKILIESGLSGEIIIQIHEDGISDEGETIIVEMGDPSLAQKGSYSSHTITISEQGLSPLIDFRISQGPVQSNIISTLSGNASIHAKIRSTTPDEKFSYDWSASDNAIVPLNSPQEASLQFDPATLTPGIYKAHLTVTDSHNLKSNKEIAFAIIDTTIPVSDSNDNDLDGLPDFKDINKLPDNYIFNLYNPNPLSANAPGPIFSLDDEPDTLGLSVRAPYFSDYQEIPYMIQTQPGLHLSRGELNLLLDQHYQISSMVSRDLIEPEDPLFSAANSYNAAQIDSGLAHNISNFVINNLPYAGYTAAFVLPLPEPITDTPQSFRVLLSNSGWQTFDEIGDSIASAVRNGHTCPPPNSPTYQSGLNSGANCLLFSVKDGGTNDSDEQANGSITMALGTLIGIEAEPRTIIEDLNVSSPTEKGGSGTLSSLFLLFTALGLGLRHNAHISAKRT